MKFIEKRLEEPRWFSDWKSTYKPQEWCDLGSLGDRNEKDLLRHELLEEQGSICCYCGKKLYPNHSTILEHLLPKDGTHGFPEKKFDYGNILASCNGGQKPLFHFLEEGDTIELVLRQYTLTQQELQGLNPKKERLGENPTQLLQDIYPGLGALVVAPAAGGNPKELHCDAKKGNKQIPLTPLQPDCGSFFKYYSNGQIGVKDKSREVEVQIVIGVLGLNSSGCVEARKSILSGYQDVILELQQQLLEEEMSASMYQKSLEVMFRPEFDKCHERDPHQMFTPYCFVIASFIQDIVWE